MDVQVGTVDIHELELPRGAHIVNVLIACALSVYIVGALWGLYKTRHEQRHVPLLNGETEL